MAKAKAKRNPTDVTLRNINALKKRVKVLEAIVRLQADALDSIEIGVRSVLANVQSLLKQLQAQITADQNYEPGSDAVAGSYEGPSDGQPDTSEEVISPFVYDNIGDYEGARGENFNDDDQSGN